MLNSGTTQVVTNDPDKTKRRFCFEQELANIARNKNFYIFAFMDCCRVITKDRSLEKNLILDYHLFGKQ